MRCSHPLMRVPLHPWEKAPRDVKVNNGAIILKADELNYNFVQATFPKNLLDRLHFIPCGKCMACRINLAEQWSVRCALELRSCSHAAFVTLTYDDDHLKYGYRINVKQRTVTPEPTLVKRDVQLFHKRLRKYCSERGVNIRYFGCGEYGSTTQRPHYHFIYFGLPDFPDRKLLNVRSVCSDSVKLYTSEILESLWSHGMVSIGEVNAASISYVARYTTKKFRSSWLDDSDRSYFEDMREKIVSEFNSTVIEDDFLMMSRRPGLARLYYDQNSSDVYKFDKLIYAAPGSSVRIVRPLRYFDRLYDLDYPGQMHSIKTKRIYRAKLRESFEPQNNLTFFDRLNIADESAKVKSRKLPRVSF